MDTTFYVALALCEIQTNVRQMQYPNGNKIYRHNDVYKALMLQLLHYNCFGLYYDLADHQQYTMQTSGKKMHQ